MGSNIDLAFEERLKAHFTPSEFVEYLGIDMDTLIDRFQDEIDYNRDELKDEIG